MYLGRMATTPSTIDVNVKPMLPIPFHPDETIRIEMQRSTVLDDCVVRAKDVSVYVDDKRLLGVQSLVVLDRDLERIAGVVIRTKRPEAAAQVTELTTEDETLRHDAEVRVLHPEDGSVLRSWRIDGARVLAHTVDESEQVAWIDLIGKAHQED